MVLVLIGVLIAALWIVRQIMINSETRDLVGDLDDARAAVHSYEDRFGHLPGDDLGATLRWGDGVPSGNGNQRVDGVWDGKTPDELGETRWFWWHLRLAGMYPGFLDGDRALALPRNASGGAIAVQNGGFGLGGTVICLSRVAGRAAVVLDTQLDDGHPNTGRVRAGLKAEVGQGDMVYTPDSDYVLCRGL